MTATAEPTLRSLYEYTAGYQAVIDLIAENGGVITDELVFKLAEIEDKFEVKAERVALYARNQAAGAAVAKAESKRLSELAAVRERTAESLEKYIFTQMKNLGKLKIERPLVTLSVVNNGGNLPVLCDVAPESLPAPYRVETISYALDKAKVLEDHKAGLPLPIGVTVGERGSHLRIS